MILCEQVVLLTEKVEALSAAPTGHSNTLKLPPPTIDLGVLAVFMWDMYYSAPIVFKRERLDQTWAHGPRLLSVETRIGCLQWATGIPDVSTPRCGARPYHTFNHHKKHSHSAMDSIYLYTHVHIYSR